MEEFLHNFSYAGVVLVLLGGGMGLPLPEDIPLLVSGYLCHLGIADLRLMIPTALAAVLAGDFLMYSLGRRYGHHVGRLPLLGRFLTEPRLKKAEEAFQKHGGKALFIGRFLPGLRACVFFSAGTFKVSPLKMLAYDGSAALISVPTLILAAYFGGEQIDKVKSAAAEVQIAFLIGVVLVIAIWSFIKKKREPTLQA
jgi:membrane protein DedA with SNARE-associated domain